MDSKPYSDKSIEELYEMIGGAIANAITQANWATAQLAVEIEENDNGLLQGQYLSKGNLSKWHTFRPTSVMYLALDELRTRMGIRDHVMWSHATFVLDRDGQFDMKVKYPD